MEAGRIGRQQRTKENKENNTRQTERKQQRKTLDKQYGPCFLVKTSPAEGRRRFHKNTAYARLGVLVFGCFGQIMAFVVGFCVLCCVVLCVCWVCWV